MQLLHLSKCLVLGWCLILTAVTKAQSGPGLLVNWQSLPALPQAVGGQMSGTSTTPEGNETLLVIGGSYFTVPPWAGGTKHWVDTVQALEPGSREWRLAGRLSHPLAYGAAVTVDDGVIVLGGSDGNRHYADVFKLRFVRGQLEQVFLPSLPQPRANFGATILGRTIYVTGGQKTPTAMVADGTLWALDLDRSDKGWVQLEPLPGPARILPVFAAQDRALWLFSGAELIPGANGQPERRYLRDGWRYQPGQGWTALVDLPRAIVAASARPQGQNHLLVFSGDDGSAVTQLPAQLEAHPGFSTDVMAYHTITRTWVRVGQLPHSLVTTAAVTWQGTIVLPGGEDRPGHRRAEVLSFAVESPRGGFDRLDYAVLGLYLLAMLLIGIYLTRKSRTTEDFFLGGRGVPWWAAGLSIYGTQLSALTYLAVPAKTFAEDLTYVLVNLCIPLMAPVVIKFYLPFFRRLNVTTAYEYLEQRFNVAVRCFGSASFIILQAGRLAIVLFLPSLALSAVGGLNIYLCILVMGVLTTIYTMEGGITAVVWTDVVQVFVLLGGALVALWLLVQGVEGGLPQVIMEGRAAGKFHMFNWTWDATTTSVWVVLIGNLMAQLVPYTTDQSVIQKYLTTSDERRAARGIWLNGAMSAPTILIFFGVGIALYVYYLHHPAELHPGVPTDATFAWFIADRLPAGVAGLVVAGLFAAAMSTLSSSMNSIATAVVTDFYVRFTPGTSEDMRMRLARRLTLLMGVIGTVAALLMATWEIRSAWDLFLQILGLFGGGLAGVFALGIFTRRAHGTGALIGVMASAGLLWSVQRYSHLHFFLYAGLGTVSCFIVGYLASLVLPAKPSKIEGLTIHTLNRTG